MSGSRPCQSALPQEASLYVSPRGETKCVRGPSGRGASRLARAGVLEQYVEHGNQAQRSPGGRIVCFGRRVVRNEGYLFASEVRSRHAATTGMVAFSTAAASAAPVSPFSPLP